MSTSVSSTGASAWPGESLQGGQQLQQSKPVLTPEQVKHAQPGSAPVTRSAIQQVGASGVSPTEAKYLISRYENGNGYPDDGTNARTLVDLQTQGLRGNPHDDVRFETQQTLARQKIEALPQRERDRFSGMQAQGIHEYESATSASVRQKVARAMSEYVEKPVDLAYSKLLADPVQRLQLQFNTPFGAQYLGAAGQHQAASLEHLRRQFDEATTPQAREASIAQAAGIRHEMQQQIQAHLRQARKESDQQWATADKEVYAALDYARSMQSATEGGFDNASSFERLTLFGRHAFTSERNVQAFQYLMQQHPDSFKDLKSWHDDASVRTEWARSAIQSDPFRRTPNLPPALPDFTSPKTDELHRGAYAAELLGHYQEMKEGVVADQQMYHAASQHGPIKAAYLDAHTPPKPLWQQQVEDVLGRFVIGLIPGVNLLADYIVPAKSLSADVRGGIDIMSGALGGLWGEAKIPGGRALREGEAGEARGGTSKEPVAKGADGGRSAHAGGGETGGIEGKESATRHTNGGAAEPKPQSQSQSQSQPQPQPQPQFALPESYASTPSGKLHADPANPAIQIDEKGRRFISDGKRTYAVRYDADNGTERAYQPDNPTKPGIPVRQNGHGGFEAHDEVGLKGGGPGRDLQSQLNRALGLREYGRAEHQRALHDLATVNAEIQRSQNPGADVLLQQQAAQQLVDRARNTIEGADWEIAAVQREAQQLRQTMQNELEHLRRHRQEGTGLEQVTVHEIDVLRAAMRIGDYPSGEMQYKLQKLENDLRRINESNYTLDYRIMNLHREIDEIPRF